jgi:hypothetical protein
MARGFLTYLRRVLWTAWEHSFHAAHSIILALIIAAGLLTYCVPRVEIMVDLHGWGVAAAVLASVIGVRLFLAPYWIWKEDQELIERLKEQIESAEVVERRRAAKRVAIDDLSQELSWAIDNLLNKRPMPNNNEETNEFANIYDDWCNKVSKKLENRAVFTFSHQTHFDSLGVVPSLKIHVMNNRYNHIVSQLSLKFDRLREIINQTQGDSRP